MSLTAERGRHQRRSYHLTSAGISTGRSATGRVVIAGILVGCVTLQSTLLTDATLFGVTPQLLLLAVICLAYLEGPGVAAVVGFSGGLLLDLLLPGSILGLSALVYTLVAYTVADLRGFVRRDSVWMPVLAVGLASAAAEGGYALLAVLLGEAWVSLVDTSRIVGLVVVYNILLTPFVFPIFERMVERFRPAGASGGILR